MDRESSIQATDPTRTPVPDRLWRGLPRAVWTVTALWCAVMTAWSLVLPIYRSADEQQHVAAGLHWDHQRSWPGFKELPRNWGSSRVDVVYGFTRLNEPENPYRPLPETTALDRDRRPSLAELGGGSPRDGIVTMGQHPPGYYVLLGTASGLLPDDLAADREIWILRLLSVGLLAPLPVVVAAATRRLGGNPATVTTAALLPLAVPQLAVLGGSINNDNALTAAGAWLALGVAVVSSGDLRARTGALIGLAAAAALLTKAFALVIVPVMGLAYLLAARRTGRWRDAVRGLAAFGATAMVGGWWWVANVVRYGQVQPSGHVAPRPDGRISLGDGIGPYARNVADLMPERFWALLSIKGGGASAFPWAVPALLSAALIALLVAVLVLGPTFGADRVDRALLVLPFVLVGATVIVSTWNIFSRTGMASGLHGRYLFAALPGVFVAVALVLGRSRLARHREAMPTIVVAVFSAVFVALCFRRAIGYHWGTDDTSLAGAFPAMSAWSPAPGWVPVVTLLAVAVTVAVLTRQLAKLLAVRTPDHRLVAGSDEPARAT